MISIVIPCYESNMYYLNKAINSVLHQTSEDWELIIADGNIEPDIRIKAFVAELNHSQVKYFHNNIDNSMAGNWNFGFSKANYELVALLHDDDVLAPFYVEQMLTLVSRKSYAAAYYCDVNIIDSEGKRAFSFPDIVKSIISPNQAFIELKGDHGLARLLRGCFIFCPTVCYRKNKLSSNPFSSSWRMVTDLQLYLDILLDGQSIVGINAKLYNYRRHCANQTSKLTKSFLRFDEEIELYEFISSRVPKDWRESKRLAEKKAIIKMHLAYLGLVHFICLNFKMSISCFKYLGKLM